MSHWFNIAKASVLHNVRNAWKKRRMAKFEFPLQFLKVENQPQCLYIIYLILKLEL